jgi:D-sedoheptulose 7-phosphate isomerase
MKYMKSSEEIKNFSKDYISRLCSILGAFDHDAFELIVKMLIDAYNEERHIFVAGNGGSASTASHFACDLNKGVSYGLEKRFRVISLPDSLPSVLAYANDVSYDSVFVEQLINFYRSGDLVIGISGSGNSENVLRCIRHANEHGGKTIGLCGFDGGKLASLAHVSFVARVNDMQKVEDLHMVVVHMLMQALYMAFHGSHPYCGC